jgi:hypothetical protein
MIVEFQKNFLNKKPKHSSKKTNLQKLVKNFQSGKANKSGAFDKRRSFTQKNNNTINGIKKSNKTYNNGIQNHIKHVNATDFKELQNCLLNKISKKGNLDKFLEIEKIKKTYKTKSKRKSLTANSWYRSNRKSKLIKRYSKKITQTKNYKEKKKHSLKTKKQESGDSGISFGDKDAQLQMAKSETVPGFQMDPMNFQSSSDNKYSLSKAIKSKQEMISMVSPLPHVGSKANVSEFPFSKYSQKNTDSRCIPSIYLKSNSELEGNDSNSIFSPKIDKEFVLSKEDNNCLLKMETNQNNYNFNSNPNYSLNIKSRPGVSLKNLDKSLNKSGKDNIYEINSIEKYHHMRDKQEFVIPSNYSNYSNYVVKKNSSTFQTEDRKLKNKIKINSSNNLSDYEVKKKKEMPSFQPIRNRNFILKQKNQISSKTKIQDHLKQKKKESKKINNKKYKFNFKGNELNTSLKTQKSKDRNREGCNIVMTNLNY